MQRLIAFLLAFSLSGAPAFAYSPERHISSVGALHASWVTPAGVTKEANMCSATVIDSKRDYWLTAAHCVANMETGELETIPTFTIDGKPVKVIQFNVKDDIAILWSETIKPALKLRKKGVKVGETVQMAGYPLGSVDPFYVKGTVIHPATDLFDEGFKRTLFDMTIAGGFSGSAITDRDGKIVSVAQVGLRGAGSPTAAIAGGATFEVMLRWQKYFA